MIPIPVYHSCILKTTAISPISRELLYSCINHTVTVSYHHPPNKYNNILPMQGDYVSGWKEVS